MLPSKEDLLKLGGQEQLLCLYDYLIQKEKDEAGRFGIALDVKKKKK